MRISAKLIFLQLLYSFGEGDGLHEGDGRCVVGETHIVEDWTECAQCTDTHIDRQTDRQTKVKTVYPPVSLRSLGGYN